MLLLQLNHRNVHFSLSHPVIKWHLPAMITYKDLKSVAYIDSVIPYVEELPGIRFKRYAEHKYSAYCPFHADTKDSFRVHLNDNQEIRFHCFGACNADWDVYNLIQKIRTDVQLVSRYQSFFSIPASHPDPTLSVSGPEPPVGRVLKRRKYREKTADSLY